jgi:hypothetical protein
VDTLAIRTGKVHSVHAAETARAHGPVSIRRLRVSPDVRTKADAMIETLAQIKAPHFTAGLVLRDDHVIEAAPIIGYMARQRWTRTRVRAYCAEKGWRVVVV